MTRRGNAMAGNFGFGPGNPGNPGDPEDSDNSANPNFNELFQQFSQFNIPGFAFNPQSLFTQPVAGAPLINRETIRDLARKFITAQSELPVGNVDQSQIQEALDIANTWLDEGTTFPALTRGVHPAWNRRDWVDASLDGWQKLVEPLAEGMANALTDVIAQSGAEGNPAVEAIGGEAALGAITPIMRNFMGQLIASQLGNSVGQLATTVTGSNDVAIPLFGLSTRNSSESAHPTALNTGVCEPHLIPQNILAWAQGLEIPIEEVRIYLALRESAAARLFSHTPWLSEYIYSLVQDYGKGIRIDIQAIQEQAEGAMNSGELDISNPQSISIAINQGMFTPEQTPKQEAALAKLEMALALIEGWIDHTTTLVGENRLPAFASLNEMLRRRRATAAPTQQLFSTLVGLQVSPRKFRECSTFWSEVEKIAGLEGRDGRWEHEGLLPSSEEISDPAGFIASTTVPDDLSGLI